MFAARARRKQNEFMDEILSSDASSITSRTKDVRLLIDSESQECHRSMDTPHQGRAANPVKGNGPKMSAYGVAEVDEQVSYTQQAVPMLANPQEMPRPRGLFRQHSAINGRRSRQGASGKTNNPTYIATRANNVIIHKSFWSRVTYTIVLMSMILWTPPWLKLLTIRRNEHNEFISSIYNASVIMNLTVSTLDNGDATTCKVCDDRDIVDSSGQRIDTHGGVTYPISVKVANFYHSDHIQAATRIVLFASWDWESWVSVAAPGLFTGLRRGDQDVEVCMGTPIPKDDGEEDEENVYDFDEDTRKKTTFTEQAKTSVTDNEDTYSGGDRVDISTSEQVTAFIGVQSQIGDCVP